VIIVVSVPHTGTVTTKYLLDNANLKPLQHHCHADTIFPFLERMKDADIVVPLRHPEKAWRTWTRRGTGLGGHVSNEERLPHFIQSWKWLDDICRERKTYYLPVDLPIRDDCLREMSEAFGVDIKADWTVRNETTESLARFDYVEADLSEVMSLDVVRKFYA